MQVIYERCAGIDIHKKMVVVTVLITLVSGQVQKIESRAKGEQDRHRAKHGDLVIVDAERGE